MVDHDMSNQKMQESLFKQSFYTTASSQSSRWGSINPLPIHKEVWFLVLIRGKNSISFNSQHGTVLWLNQHLWKLTCSTSSLWTFSSRLLSSGSLVIISPSVDDTATYECTVTNDAGEDKRTVDLTVQGRTGLVCGLTVIIMMHFIIPLLPKRASFSTY